MHVSRLSLTNVRQFDQRTFEFQPGFNLLVGGNGVGKTTILRAILATVGSSQQTGRRPNLVDDDVRLGSLEASVQTELTLTQKSSFELAYTKRIWERAQRSRRHRNTPLVLLYASNEATCRNLQVRRVRNFGKSQFEDERRNLEFLYRRDAEMLRISADASQSRFGNSQSVREFVGKMLASFSPRFESFYWRFEPYDCSLRPPEGEKSSYYEKLRDSVRSFAMRLFQENQSRVRREVPYLWPDQESILLGLQQFKETDSGIQLPDLKQIWDSMKVSEDERRYLQSCALEVRLTPQIVIRGLGGSFLLRQLSDGEQRLFSLFVDIARELSLRDKERGIDGSEAIVLIDEIDVHLHPKWQRRIVPALEDLFPNCQFIATTHSPFVIQAVNRRKIVRPDFRDPIPQDAIGNSIEDIIEDIQGIDVPQRSLRAERLSKAAEKYFRLLKDIPHSTEHALSAAEREYREASEPYTMEPAAHALLKLAKMEREPK